ncbi:MAG: protocatechuate 3,4-dioxygenase subunit alpha [Opitutales bacterium]|nr:protocatechuate 3,4-dioxygenase subunit alpha [Opitutales bacterium]
MRCKKQTPSQTVGPFFSYGLTPQQYGYDHSDLGNGDLVTEGTDGEVITITGTIFNDEGGEMKHAVVEIWQADNAGNYADVVVKDRFSGFGRVGTGRGEDPRYRIRTIKPGSVDNDQAPHITLTIFSRGLMHHAFTRLYFSDEVEANAQDPLLQKLPAERRPTLIAQRVEEEGEVIYQFDIHMQGDQETVFLEF